MSSDPSTPVTETEVSVDEQDLESVEDLDQDPVTALSTVTDSDQSLGEMDLSVESLGSFVSRYSRLLTLLAGLLLVVILIAIAAGILGVINTVPLVSPTFEVIGLSYAAWFIWRYLFFADRRQELSQEFQSLIDRIMG